MKKLTEQSLSGAIGSVQTSGGDDGRARASKMAAFVLTHVLPQLCVAFPASAERWGDNLEPVAREYAEQIMGMKSVTARQLAAATKSAKTSLSRYAPTPAQFRSHVVEAMGYPSMTDAMAEIQKRRRSPGKNYSHPCVYWMATESSFDLATLPAAEAERRFSRVYRKWINRATAGSLPEKPLQLEIHRPALAETLTEGKPPPQAAVSIVERLRAARERGRRLEQELRERTA